MLNVQGENTCSQSFSCSDFYMKFVLEKIASLIFFIFWLDVHATKLNEMLNFVQSTINK
uniref:Uncharacterized protein n=1 Tax=Physcomitrium patens TaxID=3218 RepID=A0A2K1IUQ8_PHYPA|nr:hypothetical protein PHYPA_024955 [Physcomitrium patens]